MVDIIPFGEGRKPSRDILARITAAKARLPEHDPLHDVLDAFVALVERIDATERSAAPTASAFNDDQMKSLVYQTERAAERGVGIYAKRIASWHQAIVGGAFAAGLTIGIMGTFYVASRQSAAEIDAMRLSVPAVLAAIPAADPAILNSGFAGSFDGSAPCWDGVTAGRGLPPLKAVVWPPR